MKKLGYIIIAPVIALMMACSGNGTGSGQQSYNAVDTLDSSRAPIIQFDTAVFNFGRILQGEQVSTVFKFKNVGNDILVIYKVETSCGCTVPEYDRSPVAPGESGQIRVRFDSDGKDGPQYKTVKVTSNCIDNIFDLVVMGEVEVR